MLTNELILQRLDNLSDQITRLAEKHRAREELFEELTPIAREALATAISRLDAFEKQGYFTFAAELGDTLVALLDGARDASHVKPLGTLGAVRAIRRDTDVQKGLGIVVEMLRRIGRHANATAEATAGDHKARLAALLGPRRQRKVTAPKPKLLPGPQCATPASVDVDLSQWSRATAEQLAAEQHISLTDEHWALIEAARGDFAATHASPNIQRLTQVGGVATRDLYRLFPKAPARTIAKLAGLPKPAGCL